MSTTTTTTGRPTLSTGEVERLLTEAHAAQSAVLAAAGLVAAATGLEAGLEQALCDAIARRDQVLQELGGAVLRWSTAGGRFAPAGNIAIEPATVLRGGLPTPMETPPTVQRHPTPPPTSRRDGSVDGELAEAYGQRWAETPNLAPASARGIGEPLQRVLDIVGPPVLPDQVGVFAREVERLVVSAEGADNWERFPRETQRDLLAYLVCKCRILQDETPAAVQGPTAMSQLAGVFPMLTRFSAEKRPGYVHGLGRGHTPRRAATWVECAEQYWSRLREEDRGPSRATYSVGGSDGTPFVVSSEHAARVAMREVALGHLEQVLGQEPSRAEVVRAFLSVLESGVPASDPRLVEHARAHWDQLENEPALATLRYVVARGDSEFEDWPHLARTVGRKAVVVGADLDAAGLQALTQALRLDRLDKELISDPEDLETLVHRVCSRACDLVFFVEGRHTAAQRREVVVACSMAEVPFVALPDGAHMPSLRAALDRLWNDEADAD